MNSDSFAARLKQAMEEKGLTQSALHRHCAPLCGDQTSISRQAIGTYVRGERYPADEKIHILADALGIRYEWLRDGEDQPEKVGKRPRNAGRPARSGESIKRARKTTAESDKPAEAAPEPSEIAAPEPESSIIKHISLQFSGEDMTITDIRERCREAWRQEFGDGQIQSMTVYVKPEDRKAYWVVNETDSGSVGI